MLTMTAIPLYISLFCCNCLAFSLIPILDKRISPLVTMKAETASFIDTVKRFRPLIGFYAVMLAPIYGVGFGPFGSMTDFDTVMNRPGGDMANEYIVAPEGYTPKARAHEAKVYDISAQRLEDALTKVIRHQPRISFVEKDEKSGRNEYIQRTLIFRFPDVITFKTIPIDDLSFDVCVPEQSQKCLDSKFSSLAIHSYSVYGAGDYGVNSKRVKTWLDELEKNLKVL